MADMRQQIAELKDKMQVYDDFITLVYEQNPDLRVRPVTAAASEDKADDSAAESDSTRRVTRKRRKPDEKKDEELKFKVPSCHMKTAASLRRSMRKRLRSEPDSEEEEAAETLATVGRMTSLEVMRELVGTTRCVVSHHFHLQSITCGTAW